MTRPLDQEAERAADSRSRWERAIAAEPVDRTKCWRFSPG